MVVLNVVAPKNDWTADFEEPIPKAHYVKLISGSLFNSWHNSERVATMLFKNSGECIVSLSEGCYTVESIARELTASFNMRIRLKWK